MAAFNILIIDDKPSNLDELEAILAKDNRIFHRAGSGKQALEIIASGSIDLVVTDIKMPEMDGFELLEMLKADHKTRNIYVIVITDRDKIQENIIWGLEHGAVDYLVKPLNEPVVRAKIAVFERLHYKRKLLEEQNQRIEDLLLNILPKKTAEELQRTGSSTARYYNRATILFTDFQAFTLITEGLSPKVLLDRLNRYFSAFDYIVEKYYIEKIKTIGDAYMAVGGVPIRNSANAVFAVLAAIEIREYMQGINAEQLASEEKPWELRIGLHSGPLIAGVVGKRKWQYDVWGDTVNTAARLESQGEPGKINISGTTWELIRKYFECTHRGKIKAKYKGEIDMYFVDRIKAKFAADAKGTEPNTEFEKILAQESQIRKL